MANRLYALYKQSLLGAGVNLATGPAEVRWTEGALTGLRFSVPVLLDVSQTS